MAEHNYKFDIAMSCGGCSGAVERVLKKLDGEPALSQIPQRPWPIHLLITMFPGVKSYNVSLETQSADIVTEESLDYDTVLEKIKKTGKTVKSGQADGVSRDV
jgi:copper chaperone